MHIFMSGVIMIRFLIGRLFGSQRVRFAKNHGGIKIIGVTASDNGVYSCRAVNPAGQLDSTDNFILNIPGAAINLTLLFSCSHTVKARFTDFV